MRQERGAVQRALIEAGAKLERAGLIAGSSGNLSARLARSGRIVCTPSGRAKGELALADLVVLEPGGEPARSDQRASSEIGAHLAVYAATTKARAVVHAHPVAATAIASWKDVPNLCVSAEGAATLGVVARVPYVRPGTQGLAAVCGRAAARGARAILMRQHGAICWGASLDEALHRMLSLEHVARLVLAAPDATRLMPREVAALRRGVGLPEVDGASGFDLM